MRRNGTLLAALVPLLALASAETRAAAQTPQPTQVVVDAATVAELETRLQAFAAGLPADQRQALAGMMHRAAEAPRDDPAGTPVRAVTFRPAAGAGIIVQGGRGAAQPRPSGTAAVAIGPKQDDPRARGTGVVSIGPKQDDPRARGTGVVAIGPKQDDPRAVEARLAASLQAFGAELPAGQSAVLDWMTQRAASARGTPGGLTPGRTPSLSQALGISVLAIGPKQDDPAPPPPATRWVLRF
ncbi:MAG TPA: hypothetical protein VF263_21505 [Longimicrobiaceae bacterium]